VTRSKSKTLKQTNKQKVVIQKIIDFKGSFWQTTKGLTKGVSQPSPVGKEPTSPFIPGKTNPGPRLTLNKSMGRSIFVGSETYAIWGGSLT
jgi:hypothetical protein